MKNENVIEFIANMYLYIHIRTRSAFVLDYLKKAILMHLLYSLILLLFSKRSTVFLKYALVVKENEILRRRLENNNIKVKFNKTDRRFYVLILKLYPRAKRLFSLVTPATVLYKWKCISKN